MSLAALTPPRALIRLSHRVTFSEPRRRMKFGLLKGMFFQRYIVSSFDKDGWQLSKRQRLFQLHCASGKLIHKVYFGSPGPRIRGEPYATMWLSMIPSKENEQYALTTLWDTKNRKDTEGKIGNVSPQPMQRHKHFEVWKAFHSDKIRVKILVYTMWYTRLLQS